MQKSLEIPLGSSIKALIEYYEGSQTQPLQQLSSHSKQIGQFESNIQEKEISCDNNFKDSIFKSNPQLSDRKIEKY